MLVCSCMSCSPGCVVLIHPWRIGTAMSSTKTRRVDQVRFKEAREVQSFIVTIPPSMGATGARSGEEYRSLILLDLAIEKNHEIYWSKPEGCNPRVIDTFQTRVDTCMYCCRIKIEQE